CPLSYGETGDVAARPREAARVAIPFNLATAPYAEIYLNPFKAAAASFAVEVIAAPVRDRSEQTSSSLPSRSSCARRPPTRSNRERCSGLVFSHCHQPILCNKGSASFARRCATSDMRKDKT